MSTLVRLLLIAVTLLTTNSDEIIGYTKIYPYMHISMNILLDSYPSRTTTIFSIDQFISIQITTHNTLQLTVPNSDATYSQQVQLNTPYTINITMNPSNNHYSLQSLSSDTPAIKSPFTMSVLPTQYTTTHSININAKHAKITNILITTDELNGYILYSSAIIMNNRNNVIFAEIPNNITSPSTTDEEDDYESIFGPDVTQTQEIIYVVLIVVAVICMVAVVAFATVRRCTRNRNGDDVMAKGSDDGTVNPYAPVNNGHQRGVSTSVVNFVDERPGNHDIEKLQQASIPLTASYTPQNNRNSLIDKTQGGVPETEDGATEVGIAMTTTTQQVDGDGDGNNNDDDNNGNIKKDSHLSPEILSKDGSTGNREESISAMNI